MRNLKMLKTVDGLKQSVNNHLRGDDTSRCRLLDAAVVVAVVAGR